MAAVNAPQRLDRLPPGFLDTPASELHRLLAGPTLIHLPGERGDELFVSVLQHGNEDTGLRALQRLLARYGDRPLPRPLTLFVGNVEAARHGHRHLDHQADFNRAWPGTELPPGPETRLLAEVFEIMRGRRLFASLDLHNTSGDNPPHVGVNMLDDRCLQLARLFARTVVYFTRPRGPQAHAFLGLCPALIIECGPIGTQAGLERTERFLEQCLRLETIPDEPPPPQALDLFTSVALVQIPSAIRFCFAQPPQPVEPPLDLCLPADLDRLNFQELAAGTRLAYCRDGPWPVRALDPAGHEVTAEFFERDGGELRLRRPVMPTLLSRDARILHQDCLCHLMERLPIEHGTPTGTGQDRPEASIDRERITREPTSRRRAHPQCDE